MKSQSAKTCPSCGERYGAEVLFCPKDGTPLGSTRNPLHPAPERDPYLGMELSGQIRVKHLLGVGSMGRVYCAFQGGIERDVAVKVLHRELSANADLVGRFHREAKVASRLVHPHVVQVLMTGCVPLTADPRIGGELYLVMEHLDGISLLSALAAADTGESEAALALPRALHIALQICDAVGEAHAQGIVHRDLKPENIMLVRRGEDPDFVKVLDFGIARLDWGDKSMATQAGLIFGTAKYISPEGAEGHPVGPQADVYAIATTLYQCLAGRTPFEAESPVALLVQHAHSEAPDLRSVPRASYVPAPIAQVIMQNLAKSARERASDARAFGRDLVAAARASGLDPETIMASSSLVSRGGRGAVKLASKERTKALELSAELAAKIGGVAASSSRSRGEETPVPTSGEASFRASDAPDTSKTMPGEPVFDLTPPVASTTVIADEEELLVPLFSSRSVDLPLPPPSSRSNGLPPDESPSSLSQSSVHSTMQGAEIPPSAPPPELSARARFVRTIGIAAIAAVVAVLAVMGGKHLSDASASATDESVDTYVEAARDCIRRHAWDGATGQTVKSVTTEALTKWPGDARVIEVRREAAERIVTDAIDRKYTGDREEALRLARLAIELHPSMTTAQHLVRDLETPPAEAAPLADAPVASASAEPTPPREAPRGPSAPRAPASAAPSPAASAALAPSSARPNRGGPVLPPSPPPLPADHAPAAAGSATGGPWL